MKIVAFDLDDVLCSRDYLHENLGVEKYKYCQPMKENILIMNQCYNSGYYVKIYTARGMTQFNGDSNLAKEKLYQITYEQLERWGAQFHELIFGKTAYDLLIDDKALNIKDLNFENILCHLNQK